MDQPLLASTRTSAELPGRSPRQAVIDNMRLLVQLRWIAVLGQVLAILTATELLEVQLPRDLMLGVAGLLALGNLFFTATLRQSWVVPGELLLALLLDMAALTAQLYLSGGITNPFVSLFLLQIVLGAILLRPARAWLLVGVALAAFLFLTVKHQPLDLSPTSRLGIIGEEIAFVMVAVLLVAFVTRISRNLRASDLYVAELRKRAAEEDSIVRMGLFASGAAHELGTPLASLSVLIGDWQRSPAFKQDPLMKEELEDARIAVERCREIVSNILDTSGQTRGEAMGSETAERLLTALASDWGLLHPDIQLNCRFEQVGQSRVPAEPALRQALWSLLENAGEASPEGIELVAAKEGASLTIEVRDHGSGFDTATLAAVGQIARSSKGAGHGIGLFLAANVARRLGGSLAAENLVRGGAVVRLHLPLLEQPS